MNIYKIKENLYNNKGKILKFRYNGSRNQTEEFDGIIDGLYKKIFIIKNINNSHTKRSFSYTDLLTTSLEIID